VLQQAHATPLALLALAIFWRLLASAPRALADALITMESNGWMGEVTVLLAWWHPRAQGKAVKAQQAAVDKLLADLKQEANAWAAKLHGYEKSLGECLSIKGIDICCRCVHPAS
jgi:hypothetical protein